ncbi:hypothetical protein F511_05264 [Dorcoceras hygrometricum]|uniref:DUF547 domain-containing protein n=1 Tax=Dorcoceras hygrometricum TaxID=472368 RepID=A0A2Z7CKC9_9LAMI|nr:hypothetical protein F511_05264 [Dorcoceras hygrometricum]
MSHQSPLQSQAKKLENPNVKYIPSQTKTTTDPNESSPSSSFTSLSHLLSSDTNISPNIVCFKKKPDHDATRIARLFDRSLLNDRKLAGSGCFNVFPIRPWDRLKLWLGSLPLMATQDGLSSLHIVAPLEVKKKAAFRQQKREELEREMLEHEQKVHEYLDRLDERHAGEALSLPNSLPLRMKELLAELSMVENEITRLESQINQLEDELKHEKKLNLESKSNEQGRGILKIFHESLLVPQDPDVVRGYNKKVTFDTKALHFISKAIKGDYQNTNDFRLFDDKKSMIINSKGLISSKDNIPNGRIDQGKETKGSVGSNKPPSPLQDTRNPTPRKERNLESPKVVSTPLLSAEDNIHKWAPNKLSENITKCLIFIYMRLLRTARAMDMEKMWTSETSMISSKTNLMYQKDSRQQDPYGIFDSEESTPRDIGPYKNLVIFTSSSVDPKCIQNSSSVSLFQKLKVLLDGLQKVELRFSSNQQKLAFWINMYNACVMHGFLHYGVPSVSGHEKLLTLINKANLNISGNTVSAQEIEHYILRKSADPLVQEIIGKDKRNSKMLVIQELYGLEETDPNVTFALCCGTRSSPAVKIYTAEGVTAELERSKQEYLQAAIVVASSSKKIAIPELLLRNVRDFAQDMESLVEWICHQLPTSGSLRKSIAHIGKASAIVDKIPYDYEFQYLLPII